MTTSALTSDTINEAVLMQERVSAVSSAAPAGFSVALNRPASCPGHARIEPDRAVLGAILMPGINLTVWAADTQLPLPNDMHKVDDVRELLGLD